MSRVDPTPEELEEGRREMARFVADPRHKKRFERLLRLAAWKGDPEQVAERLSWEIEVNNRSKRGRTPLIVNTTGICPHSEVVKLLLAAGADPHATEDRGLTALDIVRRRLAKYEGYPRKKIRRSPSFTPGGELKLHPFENKFLDKMREKHGESAEEYEEMYLRERRRVAEKVYDTRGELEKILPLLEAVEKK